MSKAEVWSGRGPARALRAAVSKRVAGLEGNGPLSLHMILVGNDPSARGYAAGGSARVHAGGCAGGFG